MSIGPPDIDQRGCQWQGYSREDTGSSAAMSRLDPDVPRIRRDDTAMSSPDTGRAEPARPGPVLTLRDVRRRMDGAEILGPICWEVRDGQHWIVLGPNGSGKTTLIRIASLWLHPSQGEVEVLGQRRGRTDVRRLRARIGLASASVADMLRRNLNAADVVMTASNAALEPWWHRYDGTDQDRARAALARVGGAALAERSFGTLSSGERQRVLLARALSIDPGVVLLDEPMAGLDLGGREELLETLTELVADAATPPIVLITHHVEEIPDGFTHGLLLRGGSALAQGRIEVVLTGANLSQCFGIDLSLQRHHGRWTARAV